MKSVQQKTARRQPRPFSDANQRIGLARALSKLGYCSRNQAWQLIEAGRVRLNGVVRRDPETRVTCGRDRIEVDGRAIRGEPKVYLMLNKPRGLVTTTSDEQGRETVFRCLADSQEASPKIGAPRASDRQLVTAPSATPDTTRSRPRVVPVGRLDKASEGLLLFSNDTAWAARITDPRTRLDKLYHVQTDVLADEGLLRRIRDGVTADGDFLAAKQVRVLRWGVKTCWLEVVLDEGKNRHIRRMLATLGIGVLRLMRVGIGSLQLGSLPKGQWRYLVREEITALAADTRS